MLGLAVLAAPWEGKATPVVTESSDNTGLGYLDAPSMAPGHMLRTNPLFLIPQRVPEGDWQTEVGVHWANVWDYAKDKYLIDGEWVRADVKALYAISDRLFVGGVLPVIGRTGGWADSSIESFHSAMDMGDDGRRSFPRDRSVVEFREQGTMRTLASGDDWGIGDVAGFAVWKITQGGSLCPALALQVLVSLPTGDADELEGLGASSVSVGGTASKRLGNGPALVFGGLDFSYARADEFKGLALHKDEYSGLVGLAYEYSSTLALFAQNLITSPLAEDLGEFAKSTFELSLGFKWRVTGASVVEFAVEENIVEFRNSPDIAAHLAWNTAWL